MRRGTVRRVRRKTEHVNPIVCQLPPHALHHLFARFRRDRVRSYREKMTYFHEEFQKDQLQHTLNNAHKAAHCLEHDWPLTFDIESSEEDLHQWLAEAKELYNEMHEFHYPLASGGTGTFDMIALQGFHLREGMQFKDSEDRHCVIVGVLGGKVYYHPAGEMGAIPIPLEDPPNGLEDLMFRMDCKSVDRDSDLGTLDIKCVRDFLHKYKGSTLLQGVMKMVNGEEVVLDRMATTDSMELTFGTPKLTFTIEEEDQFRPISEDPLSL